MAITKSRTKTYRVGSRTVRTTVTTTSSRLRGTYKVRVRIR